MPSPVSEFQLIDAEPAEDIANILAEYGPSFIEGNISKQNLFDMQAKLRKLDRGDKAMEEFAQALIPESNRHKFLDPSKEIKLFISILINNELVETDEAEGILRKASTLAKQMLKQWIKISLSNDEFNLQALELTQTGILNFLDEKIKIPSFYIELYLQIINNDKIIQEIKQCKEKSSSENSKGKNENPKIDGKIESWKKEFINFTLVKTLLLLHIEKQGLNLGKESQLIAFINNLRNHESFKTDKEKAKSAYENPTKKILDSKIGEHKPNNSYTKQSALNSLPAINNSNLSTPYHVSSTATTIPNYDYTKAEKFLMEQKESVDAIEKKIKNPEKKHSVDNMVVELQQIKQALDVQRIKLAKATKEKEKPKLLDTAIELLSEKCSWLEEQAKAQLKMQSSRSSGTWMPSFLNSNGNDQRTAPTIGQQQKNYQN